MHCPHCGGLIQSKRAAKKTTRRESSAAVREAVIRRANALCEVCGEEGGEVHHLIAGGMRRHRERLDTVILLCVLCHREYHRNDPGLFQQIVNRAVFIGLHADAVRAVQRRLDKLNGRAA